MSKTSKHEGARGGSRGSGPGGPGGDPSGDYEDLAGEYVLGTLAVDERDRADALMARDPAFAREVEAWRERLSPLDEAVAPVPVPGTVWDQVAAGIAQLERHAASLAPKADPGAVILLEDMRRRMTWWRRAALAGGTLAACLAAVMVASPPAFLLDAFGPLAATDSAQRFVAVVNRDGTLPALLVRVDAEAGRVEIRSLAAEQPADKSLEVWLIEDDRPAPVSLGLIGRQGGVTQLEVPGQALRADQNPLIAITLEPPGGAPAGGASGPLVYSGKLIPVD